MEAFLIYRGKREFWITPAELAEAGISWPKLKPVETANLLAALIEAAWEDVSI